MQRPCCTAQALVHSEHLNSQGKAVQSPARRSSARLNHSPSVVISPTRQPGYDKTAAAKANPTRHMNTMRLVSFRQSPGVLTARSNLSVL